MLPVHYSPPPALLCSISMRNAFEDDKLLFVFYLPSARFDISYLFLGSSETSNHINTFRDVQDVLSKGCSFKRKGWLSPYIDHDVRFDPARAPVTL